MYPTKVVAPRGFTLVETAVAVLVLGIALAISVPVFSGLRQSNELKGAAENVAAQLRLARAKAIGTGLDQPMFFSASGAGSNYRVEYADGSVAARWNLPRGIGFDASATSASVTMRSDGRASIPALVVLVDGRGDRDTISIQVSGLVLRN